MGTGIEQEVPKTRRAKRVGSPSGDLPGPWGMSPGPYGKRPFCGMDVFLLWQPDVVTVQVP